ncbi:hypothetical protein SAY86_030945 [Trapa natans]|uniref:PHD-type domain-containing protein n=1 Tax=Trapa natans TaxID=22666 RepID=A0AAN7RB34_TRANT|nr:hypothetical protein SAY86_030945 [Trapa natans]
MAGDCLVRLMVPLLEIGSIAGGKGELIKKMCEETRGRTRILDASLETPDFIMGPDCAQGPPCDCNRAASFNEEKRNHGDLCSSSGQKRRKESSLGTISESCVPVRVYKRRNRPGGCKNIVFDNTLKSMKKASDCNSARCFNAPSTADNDPSRALVVHSVELDAQPTCAISQAHVFYEKPIEAPAINDVDSAHDIFSLNSNAEPVSIFLKTRVEESGECSSSAIAIEALEDTPLREKDICISILKTNGLLRKEKSLTSISDEDGNNINMVNSYRDGSCMCKACCRFETARDMIICDSCDDAFHLSCCNSRRRNFKEIDEWLCTSCLTKNDALERQTCSVMRPVMRVSEADIPIFTRDKENSSLISLILRDTELYKSNVRVGKGIQADVSDWTGPVKGDDLLGEPEELDTTSHFSSHGIFFPHLKVCNSSRPLKFSSISNWLQCKQVIDHGKTICGKWRRAPLSEVQTHSWECFCCVFWDPCHADCAAPQELGTDEILKQLKYIELVQSTFLFPLCSFFMMIES